MIDTGHRKVVSTPCPSANGEFKNRMTSPLAVTIAALMFAMPVPALAAGASPMAKTAPGKPAKLEGMAYEKARRIILGYGWKPGADQCNESAETCERYPEIANCTSSPLPILCAMDFARNGKCLVAGTSGEAAPGEGLEDPVVTHVTFLRSPCPSNRDQPATPR